MALRPALVPVPRYCRDVHTQCDYCSTTSDNLRHCAGCLRVVYCSRTCQIAHWNEHKEVWDQRPRSKVGVELAKTVLYPFRALEARTWLHGRSERDVYKLLIDSYRLRAAVEFNLAGVAEPDSVYGGAAHDLGPFRRFVHLAEQQPGLLPIWWSPKKMAKCEESGIWNTASCLGKKLSRLELFYIYLDASMVAQMTVFAEQVIGHGVGRHHGAELLRIMLEAERCCPHTWSCFHINWEEYEAA